MKDTLQSPVILLGLALCLLFSLTLSACSDEVTGTTRVITVTGVAAEPVQIELSRTVELPVNEIDAMLIVVECTCSCVGPLEREGDDWVIYCCEQFPDCEIRINVETGDTRCAFYG